MTRLLYAGRPVLAAALTCMSRLCHVHAHAVCDALAPRAAATAIRRLAMILCSPRPSAALLSGAVGRGGGPGGFGTPASVAAMASANRAASEEQAMAVQVRQRLHGKCNFIRLARSFIVLDFSSSHIIWSLLFFLLSIAIHVVVLETHAESVLGWLHKF